MVTFADGRFSRWKSFPSVNLSGILIFLWLPYLEETKTVQKLNCNRNVIESNRWNCNLFLLLLNFKFLNLFELHQNSLQPINFLLLCLQDDNKTYSMQLLMKFNV